MREHLDEDLREILLDLERSKEQEHQQRVLLERLFDGLRVLSEPASPQQMFADIIELFRAGLEFDEAFILAGPPAGPLRVEATSAARFADTTWRPQKLFERVLAGAISATFDVHEIPEWKQQGESHPRT